MIAPSLLSGRTIVPALSPQNLNAGPSVLFVLVLDSCTVGEGVNKMSNSLDIVQTLLDPQHTLDSQIYAIYYKIMLTKGLDTSLRKPEEECWTSELEPADPKTYRMISELFEIFSQHLPLLLSGWIIVPALSPPIMIVAMKLTDCFL